MASLHFAPSALAQSALGGAAGQAQASPESGFAAGGLVAEVIVTLQGSTGDAVTDQRIRSEARRAVDIEPGELAEPAQALLALQRLRGISGVADARQVMKNGPLGGVLEFVVQARAPAAPAAGQPPALPKLHESSDALLKFIINGGVGVYSDGNAFFRNWQAFNRGSPIAPGPDTGRRVTFTDLSFEPGIGGITRVDGALYAYGATTLLASGTWGPDIYQRDDRMHVAVEKAYAGLLWAPRKGQSLNLSAGRQTYTLNDGFLVHLVKGSTNVGERRAVFLGARTAHDMAVLLSARLDAWTFKAFHLNPNEYEPLESNSKFAGANLRHDFGGGLTLDGSYIENVRSDSGFATPQGTRVPRRGISTTALHLQWRKAFGVEGLMLESELGHQRSSRADVSAQAGYVSAGYRFNGLATRPAVVLRYAQWSGDKPGSTRYERWDPLLPAGSDEWMGGMVFSKYVANSNLQQWRLRLFSQPAQTFNFTVDAFKYRAMETNNLGANPVLGTLASKDLGEELMFTGRWFIGSNYYVQTLASINWPGRALRSALPGPTRPWTSLQASLYWFF